MSAKGTTWGKHKYIRIENGRYIYSESQGKKGSSSSGISYGKGTGGDRAATAAEIHNLLKRIKLTSGKSSSKKSSSEKKEKSSAEKKESSAKNGSGTSTKTSTEAKKSTDEKKSTTESSKTSTENRTPENLISQIKEEYTQRLENYKKNLDDSSKLDQIREKQKELDQKKKEALRKVKHSDEDGYLFFVSELNKPKLSDLYERV